MHRISLGYRGMALTAVASLLLVATATHARSAADCAAEADRVVRNSGSALGGATRGAVQGALFGAIVGDRSKSARRGAALGAIVGGVKRHGDNDRLYRQVYDECMRGYRY